MKKGLLTFLIICFGLALTGATALAFPTKPVELIAPANPGGGWDLTCRSSAKVLQEEKIVPVSVTVANKPGGFGATVWNDIVRNRRTDDHLLVAFSSVLTTQLALKNIKGTYKDITPIASLFVDYGVIAVKKDSPHKTLKDLLSAMKQDPLKVSVAGSSPPGALDHIKLCLLAQTFGVKTKDVRYVAFQGGADALAQLLGGHVTAFVGDAGEIAAHSEAGTVTPLATLSPQRLHGIYKNVPTAKEAGVDVVSGNWRGFYGPPEMPKAAVAYWEQALGKMVKTEGWKKVLQQNAWIELYLAGSKLEGMLAKELADYEKILNELGLIKK
ncbi:MAG: tripartite tricarboxylate transporter substrate-binding protein [Thermodesulfobacteriota bacterium]